LGHKLFRMEMDQKTRAVFFDRDGVINEVFIDEDGSPFSPKKLDEFKLKPGIIGVIKGIHDLGYRTIIITNQPNIARGLTKPEELEEINDFLREELDIDDLAFCPHDDDDNCYCRKPKPGMIEEMAKKYNIDLEKSFMIGDTIRDVGAGEAVGCQTIIVDTDYNQGVKAHHRVESILDITDIIKK